MSILADVCSVKIASTADSIGVDYYLGDDPDVVLSLLSKGIKAYIIERPWNKEKALRLPFHVQTVTEFLNQTVYTGSETYTNKN
jgi:hypothetical protein